MRSLIGWAGLIVGFFGFMNVTTAWMHGAQAGFVSWATLIGGALMWIQYIPVMSERERKYMREQAKKRKG